MKKNIYKSLIVLLFLQITNALAQAPVRDRWDTLYANVHYTNTSTYNVQVDARVFGNKVALISDSINITTSASYFQIFNTVGNTLTNISYNRLSFDAGARDGAVYTNTSTGTDYVFFGARNTSTAGLPFGFYQYSSSTNAISSESFAINSINYYPGTMNMGFYSPSTGNDSLSIFVGINYVNGDSIYIYRKHYNQVGVVTTGAKLPIQLNEIDAVFNFNGDMYVAGHQNSGDGKLLKSSDGINFNVITNFETNYAYKYIVDACVHNGKLYLGLSWGGSQGYSVIKTPDGSNFTTVFDNPNSLALTSIAEHDNTVWFSYYVFFGSKTSNPNQSTQSINYNAPYVGYLDPSENEVLSIDTLGRYFCQGETFKVRPVNSKLYLVGNYFDEYNYNTPGNFVYQFIPPVANFTMTGTNICAGTIYNYVSQSQNVDSVRWYLDNVNISTNSSITWSFTPGSHTLGLIAISGTQKDTMQYAFNAYTIGISLNPAINGCLNTKITLSASLTAAVNPVTYTWNPQSTLTQTSVSNPNCVVTTSTAGTYTYDVSVTDANGCYATSVNNLLIIAPNKDITGAVDIAAVPLTAGNVVLYKYEPILTKFDSITYQPLNTSGTFTFSLADAYTYLLRCEPTANTLQITYAPSEINWKTATVVSHGCSNNTTQTISVIPILNIGTGSGILAGKITEGIGYANKSAFSPGNPIGGLTIKGGKNPGGGIVAQGRTNAAGEYTFSNLPPTATGEYYFILVDVPGLDTSSTYRRAITTGSMSFTDLDFVVDSAKINPTNDVGINELSFDEKTSVSIFPNPTNGALNIHFKLSKAEQIDIRLFDIHGKLVRSIPSSEFQTDVKLQTQLHDLNAGVYFVRIKIGDAERATRIVITK